MGKIVSVWSQAGKTGKTLFLYNLANHIAACAERDLKILVCCANLASGKLMELFGIARNELNLEDMVNYKIASGGGIDILEGMAKRENIYFAGSRNTGRAYAARNINSYEELFTDFKDKFDLVFVDAMSGQDDILTNMLLKKSDDVLNIITQDKGELDAKEFKTDRDMAYIINNYRNIYPDAKSVSSMYRLGKPVYTLPWCEQLQEMKNRGRLSLYIQHDTLYNATLKEIAGFVAGSCHLKLRQESEKNGKKKGLLKNMIVHAMGGSYE